MSKEKPIFESSKEIVQSYMLTTAGRDWGIFAEKFLLRLVEIAQGDIQELDFKHGTDLKPHSPTLNYPNIKRNASGDVFVSIPMRDLLPSDGYRNYEYIRETVQKLQGKIIYWEAPKTDKKGNIVYNEQGAPIRKWKSVHLIEKAEGENDINSCITVRIDTDIWKAMVDFSKGFRAFDLNIAMKLQNKYALRLYQLMSRQETPLTFTIEELKKQWGLEGKYERADNFIRRTIEPAKEELDAISPYSFRYDKIKSNTPGRGNKPITSITFIPKRTIEKQNPTTIEGFDKTQMLSKRIRDILRNKYEFEWYEIESTIHILYTAQKLMDEEGMYSFLYEIFDKATTATDTKKYLIGALKKRLKEQFSVNFPKRKKIKEK